MPPAGARQEIDHAGIGSGVLLTKRPKIFLPRAGDGQEHYARKRVRVTAQEESREGEIHAG
jgi:hypothetical protein